MKRGFLKEHATAIDCISRFVDPGIAVLCTLFIGRAFSSLLPPDFLHSLSVYIPFLIIFIFPSFGLYRSWRGLSIPKEVWTVLLAWLTVVISFNALILLLSSSDQFKILWPFVVLGHGPFLAWAALVFLVLGFSRVLLRMSLRWARVSGYNCRNAVIIGAGDMGRQTVSAILENPWMGYLPNAFFDDDPQKQGTDVLGVKVASNIEALNGYLENHKIDCVFIALPFRNEAKIREVLSVLSDHTCDIKMVPDLYSYYLLNSSVGEAAGLPVINICSGITGYGTVIKWLEDKILALAALTVSLPVMVLVACLIKLSSPGPVVFKQHRYGFSGRRIVIYKFRTMTVWEDGPTIQQARRDDPRVTPVGSFLRKYSLDELPQLVNVLQGSLSIVGPRPHAVAHNEHYRKHISRYMLRHKVKPGITGWAQVNGWRGETRNLEEMEKRIQYDLDYINNWSLMLDLKIIFLTLARVFSGHNAY